MSTKENKILIAESGTGYGGSAKYMASLVPLLERMGFEVEIAAYSNGPVIQKIRESGVPVHFRKRWRFAWAGDYETVRGKKGPRFLHAASIVFRSILQLGICVPSAAIWLKQNHFRLVHLNNEILTHIPLLVASRLAGCKTVCHLHGWRQFTRMEKLFTSCVDEFVSISESGSQFFSSQLRGRRVVTVMNGLDCDRQFRNMGDKRDKKRRALSIDPDEIVVGIVGRLVPWKGQKVFIHALSHAMKAHPEMTGMIVGNDESRGDLFLAELKSFAEQLGIADKVRFLSWQADMESVYAAMDIVVHASTRPEPFGLVILEAMAAAKPVIATRAGGVLDLVVEDETGLLVEPGNVHELTDAILRFANDRDFARSLVQKAEARARSFFTIERNAAQVSDVYKSLLGQR